jgi:hypothetical protein
MEPGGATQYLVDCRFSSARALHAALAAARPAAAGRQVAGLAFEPAGLTVRWQHESKALQAGVYLGRGLFSAYALGAPRAAFGAPYATLLDALAVLAQGAGEEVALRYPGPAGELLLECVARGGVGREGRARLS